MKFNDVNGNGVRDAGEPGLPGVDDPAHERFRHCDDDDQRRRGSLLVHGSRRRRPTPLAEVVPNGFTQTAPAAPGTLHGDSDTGHRRPPTSSSATRPWSRDPTPPPSPAGRSWTSTPTASSTARSGLRGHRVRAARRRRKRADRRPPTRTGNFTFSNLPAGTYVLSEILPPNFFQTFPGTHGRSRDLHDHSDDGTGGNRLLVPEQMLRAHSRGGLKMTKVKSGILTAAIALLLATGLRRRRPPT